MFVSNVTSSNVIVAFCIGIKCMSLKSPLVNQRGDECQNGHNFTKGYPNWSQWLLSDEWSYCQVDLLPYYYDNKPLENPPLL